MSSVATNVFVNGQWTTQHVTLDEILENERKQAEAAARPRQQKPPEPTPTLGLLSRTVLRSPIINWIIPARVRHRDYNDVVFIGDDFVHIKEIGSDGHLHHVASKTDFDSRIRAARCFGEPRRPASDARLQVKIEESDDRMEDAFDAIPPQVIVLTLESRKVVFLFARQDNAGHVTFIQREEALPSFSFMEQPGKHLAVDPKSRAIAIAACEERLLIYTTKSMAAWRTDCTHGSFNADPFAVKPSPIVEERALKIENGIILVMEFLTPASSDNDNVVLLVIFSVGGKTKMSCYEWDAKSTILGPHSSVISRVERFPLDHEESHPLFVIPLQQSPGFLLVGERSISLYQDVLAGSPRRSPVTIPNKMPQYSGSSQRRPLWTHWARPARNWVQNGKLDENFYIVREDGTVLYVQVNPAHNTAIGSAGQFQCTVDSAFASLDVGLSLMNPDVLVAAGNMSYGEVIKIGEWSKTPLRSRTREQAMEFEYLESLPNWAPVMDTAVSSLPGIKSEYERQRDTVLTTSGRAPYGSISELRHGLNARIWALTELPGRFGITGMWTLFDPTTQGVFFLVSHPWQSRLYHMSISSMEVSEINEEDCDMELNKETLVACSINPRWVVQVTESALHLLRISAHDPQFRRGTRLDFPTDSPVHAAAIDRKFPIIILAIRQGSQSSLELRQFKEPNQGNGDESHSPSFAFHSRTLLSADTTCVQLIGIRDKPYAFVGTTKGELLVFGLDENGFSLVLEQQVEARFMQDMPVVCESVALLSSDKSEEYTLVCGMRNGCLYSLRLRLDYDHHPYPTMSIAKTIVTPMGHTSAKVFECFSIPNAAFVLCGSECCRLKFWEGNDSAIRPEIDNIWFTDHGTPGFQQPPVSAIAQIPYELVAGNAAEGLSLAGCLLTISDSTFRLAQLDHEVKAVPRRLIMEHTPYRLMYSNRRKLMVVAATVIKEKKGKKDSNGKGFRSVRSVIQLIRLDDDFTNTEIDAITDDDTKAPSKKSFIIGEVKLLPHEKVYAFLDWHLDIEGRKFEFLIVGTGIVDADGSRGRMMFYQTSFDDQGKALFKPNKIRELKDPVYAMAFYDDHCLMYTCGIKVYIEEFSKSERKWLAVSQYPLPSVGIQITVQAPTVYVSTAQDSVYALGLGESPSGRPTLQPIFSDARTRDTLNHLVIKLPPIQFDKDRQIIDGSSSSSFTLERARTIVLVSDKSSSIAGLLQPSKATLKNAAPTVFEGVLPRSVTRLRRGTIRPPWRRYHPKSFAPSQMPVLQHDFSPEQADDPPTPSPIPGVLVDDIIGTAVDGTLFAFSILDTPAWNLLKFIENLISAHEACTTLSSRNNHSGNRHVVLKDVLEYGMEGAVGRYKPTAFHVNGDKLAARFKQARTPVQDLRKLVFEGTDDEVSSAFVKIVTEFLPLGPGTNDDVKERVVECVEEWLSEVLDSVL